VNNNGINNNFFMMIKFNDYKCTKNIHILLTQYLANMLKNLHLKCADFSASLHVHNGKK